MNTFKLDAVFNLYTTVKKAELQQDGTIIAKDKNDNVVNINMTNINYNSISRKIFINPKRVYEYINGLKF